MTFSLERSGKKPEGDPGAYYNKTIREYFFDPRFRIPDRDGAHSNPEYTGEVGLEIECEGVNLPSRVPSHWNVKEDGSLRPYGGHPSYEYVLREPVNRDQIPTVLKYLQAQFTKAGTELHQSHRTSVHVHLNVLNTPIKKVMNIIGLWYIFEEILTKFCGPGRSGNLFALRAKDAEEIIHTLVDCCQGDSYGDINSDELRYAALNCVAMAKYGSLEFRGLRGNAPFDIIEAWVNLLLRLKDSALQMRDPLYIVEQFSIRGPDQLIRDVFGMDLFERHIQSLGDYRESMRNGMRMMQDIAFACDWSHEGPPKELIKKKGQQSASGDTLATYDMDASLNRIRETTIRPMDITATYINTATPRRTRNPAPIDPLATYYFCGSYTVTNPYCVMFGSLRQVDTRNTEVHSIRYETLCRDGHEVWLARSTGWQHWCTEEQWIREVASYVRAGGAILG